ncbi:hypothetical protein DENSPDRAFT_660444 [Dentipellis sp. KUC8613]|nr:hypothetical protein DENSPDRAFT_660444 [Dentipellis sp. KUC8613]
MNPADASERPDEDPRSPYFLTSSERWWRARLSMLEARGYTLRLRYRPGWKPSWLETGTYSGLVEDGVMKRGKVDNMDAIRMSDGIPVHIKALVPYSDGEERTEELDVALFFSSEPRRSDPRNHCVPVLDWWRIPEERTSYMVMPLLRACTSPPFITVGEAVDFFGQIFEGLSFMHEHRTAHRDCCSANIMMDPSKMYPKSFHPIKTDKNRDLHGKAPHMTRTDCAPRYYLIDFGLSDRFDPHSAHWPPVSVKTHGADRTAPELNHSPDELYDPFPTDIYYIGNVVRTEFLEKYSNIEFMESLIRRMTAEDPHRRPNIHEAVAEFKNTRQSLSALKLRSRLVQRSESSVACLWRTSTHLLGTAKWIGTRRPAIPSRSNSTTA